MITENELKELVAQYLKTEDGGKDVEDAGYSFTTYTKEDIYQIAVELRDTLVNAFLSVVREPDAHFDMSGINIGTPTQNKDGQWVIRVLFSDASLYRPSLDRVYGGRVYFTGVGVKDIFALFTQGYSTKPVYGFWWSTNGGKGKPSWWSYSTPDKSDNGTEKSYWIRSKAKREANGFINRSIAEFEKKYPLVHVEYPKEWHL